MSKQYLNSTIMERRETWAVSCKRIAKKVLLWGSEVIRCPKITNRKIMNNQTKPLSDEELKEVLEEIRR